MQLPPSLFFVFDFALLCVYVCCYSTPYCIPFIYLFYFAAAAVASAAGQLAAAKLLDLPPLGNFCERKGSNDISTGAKKIVSCVCNLGNVKL